jgi:hypothetical protein
VWNTAYLNCSYEFLKLEGTVQGGESGEIFNRLKGRYPRSLQRPLDGGHGGGEHCASRLKYSRATTEIFVVMTLMCQQSSGRSGPVRTRSDIGQIFPNPGPDFGPVLAKWLNSEPDRRSGSAEVRFEPKFGTELCHH